MLHFPDKDKSADFEQALQRKIENNDFDFGGVWFTAVFFNFEFRADAYFGGATFSGVADFNRATFSGGADFNRATFKRWANFSFARFNGLVSFEYASFNDSVRFRGATFGDRVQFAGHENRSFFLADDPLLELQFARIEKPEHISFHTLILQPFWFVNVDSRKFEFINVDWHWRNINEEIKSLRSLLVSYPHRMLAIACRHLAVNAEESHRYEEASKFRYMAMDARRLEHFRGFAFWTLSWWYWVASGYGERVLRAAAVLLGILLVSAALYTQLGFARWEPRLTNETEAAAAKRDATGAPLKLSRALTYSAAVMAFQRPEPRPATTPAQTIVLLETILGPRAGGSARSSHSPEIHALILIC